MSRINMTDDADTIARKIQRAKTDPEPLPDERGGAREAARGRQPRRHLRRARRQDQGRGAGEFGGAQFSTFKKALAELAVARLAPVNAEMNRLLADPAEIDRVLADGARKARAIAAPIVDQVKDIVGFLRRERASAVPLDGACAEQVQLMRSKRPWLWHCLPGPP